MELKHTKGPWKLFFAGEICGANGEQVIALPFDSYKEFNDQPEVVKANYRLIAAAPELLAALQSLYDLVAEEVADGEYTEQAVTARAAIAYATGATL